jgi:hypothetical protein
MNNDCTKEWSHQYIRSVLPLTFINKELKEHREQILFDRERALMPATQLIIERRLRIQSLQKEEEHLRIQIEQIKRRQYEVSNAIHMLRYGNAKTPTETAAEKFVRACPNENCRGFLNKHWQCGICQLWTCNKCHVIKGNAKDADHTCDPNNIATANLLNQDTKPCPKCGFGIFKIDGCNQMYCTQCNTAFDWRTGHIETNNIHNHHYFEWMRRQSNNPERNPNDIICGRELDHRLIRVIYSEINSKITNYGIIKEEYIANHKPKADKFTELARNIIHLRTVEMQNYEYNYIRNNEELRIMYMLNKISEDEFKHRLQIQNKKNNKQIELRNILRLVVDSMTDIIYRFYTEIRTPEWNFDFSILEESEKLQQYANECLADICHTYSCIKIQLDPQFNLIKMPKK